MNRDESIQRGPEIAPTLHQNAWIAPIDSESKGTWMGVHASGIVLCLLNRYDDAAKNIADITKSRGALIPQLLNHTSADDIEKSLYTFIPNGMAPFILVMSSPTRQLLASWTGKAYNVSALKPNEWHFFTSSSFKEAEVSAYRHDLFEEWRRKAIFEGLLPAIHVQQDAQKATHSPLMKRPETATRSITQAVMRPNLPHMMRYWGDIEKLNSSTPAVTLQIDSYS